jgi:adenylate cyclase
VSKSVIGLALGLACAVAALAIGRLPFVRTIELKTYDGRMRLAADPAGARPDIVIVAINEDSLRRLEPVVGRWPWPRLVHAQLLNFLARGRAKVIAYDVIFTERDKHRFDVQGEEWTGEESDRELAEATARAGTVVHIADAVAEPLERDAAARLRQPSLPGGDFRLDTSVEERPIVTLPIPGLLAASRAIGHNFVVLDPDGPLRRSVPFIRAGGRWIPSLGVAAAIRALGVSPAQVRLDSDGLRVGDRFLPLVAQEIPSYYGAARRARRALINYRAGVSADEHGASTYPEYSFYDLFYAEQQILAGQTPHVDPAAFKDKIVMVGATAPALDDLFTVPFPGKMPGAQMHAAVVDDILSRRPLRPASWRVSAGVTLAAGITLGVVAVALGPWPALGVAAAGSLGLAVVLTFVFARGTWVSLTEPLVAVALATLSGVTYQYMVEGREKRRVKQMFGRYVSRDVYEQLMQDPSRARLGGQRRDMSVLFSDIRGFTTVSEAGEPEAIVGQLNEYFSRMVPYVFANRGTVDKFVGDMIMALFGAPLSDPDHADHAVKTAIEMVAALREMNEAWMAAGRPALDIGVGVNSGDMVAGNIGSESIMSYTVIGDNVNLGSRLESLNKNYQSRIIISDATRSRLKGQYDIRPLGAVTVKGKTRAVDIYEVVVPSPVPVETGTPAHERA